jgi:phosphopantetheinyl transferase (holo-ACP synthase)
LALAEFWAAKCICQSLSAVEIVNDPTGRPLIKVDPVSGEKNRSHPEISISHGGGYGAALAADAPCGIDLQEQKDTLLRVLDKYCTAEEDGILAASLPDMAPPARLSLLWTAKEAAKKACSYRWMPGFLDLKLEVPVRRDASCQVLSLTVTRMPKNCRLPGTLTVPATTFHNYGLAVCMINEAQRDAGTAGS